MEEVCRILSYVDTKFKKISKKKNRYGPKYENGEWKSRTNRELEEVSKRRKYSKMGKMAKDKLVRSPRENGGG